MDFYNTNQDFREYVERYCRNYVEGRKITVEEALTHAIVRAVEEEYRERMEDKK